MHDAGIPLVKLGIVDDGNPNAFTFGRTPSDARMWVTRGLLERLDEREVDAVITHEVGHVKHWDFVVMTVAAVVPMLLYFAYLTTRFARDRRVQGVALGAYVAYVISQFLLLGLSRAREYGADHWSCECTGDGDALASALVKVAYGMGQVRAQEQAEAQPLVAAGKQGKPRRPGARRATNRIRSMRAMGIFDPRAADAMAVAFDQGIDADRAVAAMRWDIVNPWGATLEKLSSHPLVARRIEALEESGLPGAPRHWGVLRAKATVDRAELLSLRSRWARRAAHRGRAVGRAGRPGRLRRLHPLDRERRAGPGRGRRRAARQAAAPLPAPWAPAGRRGHQPARAARGRPVDGHPGRGAGLDHRSGHARVPAVA